MWVSKRFDLSWRDLGVALVHALRGGDGASASARVEAYWGGSGSALACLSVRSGFDLMLGTLALPPGSKVVFSAMTVGDMPRIAEAHGLVPVACDLSPGGVFPGVADLERACGPDTRMVVLAHLYGSRVDPGELVRWARARNLVVVEDCAQAYSGVGYRGHPEAHASFFSFGPIKYATALGGGVAVVRDAGLLDRMRRGHEQWPEQPPRAYLVRVVKYAALNALASRPLYTAFSFGVRAAGGDLDALVNQLTRGFRGADILPSIRRRPAAALLRLLARRLGQDVARLPANEARARAVLSALGTEGACPGASVRPHSFWLLPILCSKPAETIALLRRRGFEATRGRSFVVVGGESGAVPEAARIYEHAVYVPLYPAMSDSAVERLSAALREAAADGLIGIEEGRPA